MTLSNALYRIKIDTSGEEVDTWQTGLISKLFIILARRICFFKIPKPYEKQTAVNI